MDDNVWAWIEPTAYVSPTQAKESRSLCERIRKNDPDWFAALVQRYREYGY